MNKNIKEVKLNDLIKFNEHYHTVFNNEIDCSNMVGLVVNVENQGEHITVELKSKKYKIDLEDFDNCLSFNFPDDEDQYNDVTVDLINQAGRQDE